jgi:hypothetical protein
LQEGAWTVQESRVVVQWDEGEGLRDAAGVMGARVLMRRDQAVGIGGCMCRKVKGRFCAVGRSKLSGAKGSVGHRG